MRALAWASSMVSVRVRPCTTRPGRSSWSPRSRLLQRLHLHIQHDFGFHAATLTQAIGVFNHLSSGWFQMDYKTPSAKPTSPANIVNTPSCRLGKPRAAARSQAGTDGSPADDARVLASAVSEISSSRSEVTQIITGFSPLEYLLPNAAGHPTPSPYDHRWPTPADSLRAKHHAVHRTAVPFNVSISSPLWHPTPSRSCPCRPTPADSHPG